jgi:hypothetical protein
MVFIARPVLATPRPSLNRFTSKFMHQPEKVCRIEITGWRFWLASVTRLLIAVFILCPG